MHHWLKPLLIGSSISIALIASLVAGGLGYLRGDPSRLEPVLEWSLSRVFNRQLIIGELLEAELTWDARVKATAVSLANPEWSEQVHFVAVDELELEINLPSLWREGPIIIHSLQLTRPRVHLERVDGHAATWDLWAMQDDPLSESDQLDTEGSVDRIFPVVLLDLVITDGTLVFKDKDQDLLATMSGAIVESPVDGLLQVDFDGGLNATPFKIDGYLGPASGLLGGSNLQLDLIGSWGQLELLAKGSVADARVLAGPDLSLEVRAPTSRLLLDTLGMPEVRDGPLALDARISHDEETVAVVGSWSLEEFKLDVDATIENFLALDGVEVSYELVGPSLQELGFMFDIAGIPDLPFAVTGRAYRHGTLIGLVKSSATAGDTRLSIDAELPAFPEIDDWRASIKGEGFNLSLVAPFVGITELPVVPYEIAAELRSDENGVELVDVAVNGDNSSMMVKGVIGEGPDFFGTDLAVSLDAGNMAVFGKTIGLFNLPPEPFSLTTNLRRADRAWQIDDSLFRSDSFNLAITGETEALLTISDFSGSMNLSTPDLTAMLSAYGLQVEALQRFPLDVKAKFGGSPTNLLVSDAKVIAGASSAAFEGIVGNPVTLEGLNLSGSVSGPNLLELLRLSDDVPDLALPYHVSGSVVHGEDGFRLSDASASLAGGKIALEALLSNRQDYADSTISLSAQGDNLNQVVGPWLERELPVDPFTLEAELVYRPPLIDVEQLSGNIAGNQLEAVFNIEGEGTNLRGQGSISLVGNSSRTLSQIVGADSGWALPDRNYTLNAKLDGGNKALSLNPLTITHGKSDLSGSIVLRYSPVPSVEANLRSNYVDLTHLVPSVDEMEANEAKRAAAGGPNPKQELTDELSQDELAERAIPDIELDFGWLHSVQGSLAYTAKAMDVEQELNATVELALKANDGKLTVEKLEWNGPRAQGTAMASVTSREEDSTFDLYIRSRRIPLIWVFTENLSNDQETLYRLRISGQGASLREWAASLDGALVFRGGGGRMNNRGMDLFLGDIVGEVFEKLVPTAQSEPYTNLECHAGATLFKQGEMEVVPGLAIRTDKVDVVASGRVNLKNEKLDIAFNTRSRKGVGISVSKAITPYVKLGGNLANPQLAFDAKGAAVSGGAAVATGGLSILAEGMWDRWVATSKNPCKVLYDSADKDARRAYRRLLAEPTPGSF